MALFRRSNSGAKGDLLFVCLHRSSIHSLQVGLVYVLHTPYIQRGRVEFRAVDFLSVALQQVQWLGGMSARSWGGGAFGSAAVQPPFLRKLVIAL